MRKFVLSRMLFFLPMVGLLCWTGCKAKQEAESLPRTTANQRQMAVQPKNGNSNQALAGSDSSADRTMPPMPPNRPPVVLKAPKLLDVQAAPPLEKSEAMTDPLPSSNNLAKSADSSASKTIKPETAPEVEAFQRPFIPPVSPNSYGESKDPISLQIDNNQGNPLRLDEELSPVDESELALKAAKLAQESNSEKMATLRSMARAMPAVSLLPIPPLSPPAVPEGASPSMNNPLPASPPVKSDPPAAMSVMSASAGAMPPEADPSQNGNYEVVKVFYGTDRAPLSVFSAKNTLFRGYLTLTLAIGGLTLLLAFLAYRVLRWRSIKAMYMLSLSATFFLCGLTGYAAFYGRLPGQAATAIKTVDVAYGDHRGTLELGQCEVSIPKNHEVGEVESPSMLRLEFSEDPNKHVAILKVAPEQADEFYANLRESVAKSNENSALVFIHGFNVTFEDAARRTAQIAFDLKFTGVPIFYSWPSQGKLLDYAVDETNAVWTVPHLRQFLADVARQSGAKQIHLIAHSMGNRALTSALKDLALQSTDSSMPHFDQVLLTAPDIDADVFKNDIAPAIKKTAERVTLYASSNDAALLLSKKLHGYPRAGEAGRDIVIVPGMDTVDVTAVDTSLLGHSYYGDSGSVLSDFIEVLQDAKPADQRKWLRPEFLGANKYWVFQR
jgi:esterase/lipase superfamily enzyme